MDEARKYVVRPFRPTRSDLQESFKVHLSPASIHRLGFHAGDMCQLRTSDGRSLPAILWPAVEKIQDSIVLTTKVLQDLFRLRLGEQICIFPGGSSLINAENILLSDITTSNPNLLPEILNQTQRAGWTWLLQYELERAGILCPGMTISVQARGEQRSFKIRTVNGKHDLALYCPSADTAVKILDDNSVEAESQSPWTGSLELTSSDIGGLDAQIQFLNQLLLMYGKFANRFKHDARRGKVILHGPRGTGKSMILRKLSGSGWRKVLHLEEVNHDEGPRNVCASMRQIFTDAKRYQPSMITIDNLEFLAAKKGAADDQPSTGIATTLGKELDQLGDSLVFVIATTENLTDIDKSLREPQRFDYEIAVPAPTKSARYDILKLICGMPKEASDERLESVALHTHGYAGSDLNRVIRDARRIATCRNLEYSDGVVEDGENQEGLSQIVTEEILSTARMQWQPTTMKEVFLDVPKVKWTDIVGQDKMKSALKRAVEWPIKYHSEIERTGIRPPTGLLLYGPPGCSKTLAAKAVATETNFNFLAVKGGEILNMYVGESERALRDIFRKARNASPSVLFFDEIDAIASSRGYSHPGSTQVLTTLLNELDGIESLNNVFVLAATNRPQTLDMAILRPGRLEKALYVGLPDYDTRLGILQLRTSTMDVESRVDLANLAQASEGHSGAEIVALCNEAGTLSIEDGLETGTQQRISQDHFKRAMGRVPKQVRPEKIAEYEAWGKWFGATS